MFILFKNLFVSLLCLCCLACAANDAKFCSSLIHKIITSNDRNVPNLIWDFDSNSITNLTLKNYQESASQITELLNQLPQPSEVTIIIRASSDNQYDKVKNIIELSPQLERNAHPKFNLNTFQHEFTHTYNNHFFNTKNQDLVQEIQHSTVVQKLERLFEQTRQPNANYKEIISQMKALDALKPRESLRLEILTGYDELLADLMTVIANNDPRAMYKSILSSHSYNLMLEKIGASRRALDFLETYRRFDYHFGDARLQKWKDDLFFFMNNQEDFSFNRYLLFAPSRSWLWDIFKNSVNTKNPQLPKMIKILYETVFDQLEKNIDLIERKGIDAIDPIAINRELIESVKAQLDNLL